VEIGTYSSPAGGYPGYYDVERNGVWAPAIAVTLPASAPQQVSGPSLQDVSCWSASDCKAVGSFNTATSFGVPFVVSLINGVEQDFTQLPYPTGTDAAFGGGANAIRCFDVSDCIVLGFAAQIHGTPSQANDVLAPTGVKESAGTWGSPVYLPMPGGVPAETNDSFTGFTCASLTFCAAVGVHWLANSSTTVPVLDELNGATWSNIQLRGLPSWPNGQMTGVACANASSCVATAVLSSNKIAGLFLVDRINGVWRSAVRAPVAPGPSIANPGYGYDNAVSCPAVSKCGVVSLLPNRRGDLSLTYLQQQGASWTSRALPIVKTYRKLDVFALNCVKTTCVALTQFRTPKYLDSRGFADIRVNGRWLPSATLIPLPRGFTGVHAQDYPILLTCGSEWSCLVYGGASSNVNLGTDQPFVDRIGI
jgi:hypothetical protein